MRRKENVTVRPVVPERRGGGAAGNLAESTQNARVANDNYSV